MKMTTRERQGWIQIRRQGIKTRNKITTGIITTSWWEMRTNVGRVLECLSLMQRQWEREDWGREEGSIGPSEGREE